MPGHWVTARVLAVLFPAAVALLAVLYDTVSADGSLRFYANFTKTVGLEF